MRVQVIGFTTAIFFLSCALATTTEAQSAPAALPQNCSAYASVPLPPEAAQVSAPNTPPDCASYRSYQGIGRPTNYSEARACAWRERLAQKDDLGQNAQEPLAWVVGGSLILADVYFNAAAVKRDIPLAMRFACESEPDMATLAMAAIVKLGSSPGPHRRFEFCDYAADTLTETFCSSYESEIAGDRRSRYYRSLAATMTAEQDRMFTKLIAAEKAYVRAHAAEVNQGGSFRNIRTLNSQQILENLFHLEIVKFERRQWPPLSGTQIAEADALLRHAYDKQIQQLQAQTKQAIEGGAVSADNVAKVQKTWEPYLDAWAEFARVRYPAAVAAIRAQITLDRYHLLKTLS